MAHECNYARIFKSTNEISNFGVEGPKADHTIFFDEQYAIIARWRIRDDIDSLPDQAIEQISEIIIAEPRVSRLLSSPGMDLLAERSVQRAVGVSDCSMFSVYIETPMLHSFDFLIKTWRLICTTSSVFVIDRGNNVPAPHNWTLCWSCFLMPSVVVELHGERCTANNKTRRGGVTKYVGLHS